MARSKGFRRRSRSLFRRPAGKKGKNPLGKLLEDRKPGEKVCIKINPSVHKGMPHKRFHGKYGIVKAKRGRSYMVQVQFGRQLKTVIVRPEHLD